MGIQAMQQFAERDQSQHLISLHHDHGTDFVLGHG